MTEGREKTPTCHTLRSSPSARKSVAPDARRQDSDDSPSEGAESTPRGQCELLGCANRRGLEWVYHPQRGQLLACWYHRERIEDLEAIIDE